MSEKYPIANSASSAVTKPRFSPADVEPARTARILNATTRTLKKKKKKSKHGLVREKQIIILLTCAKEGESIVDMSWMDE